MQRLADLERSSVRAERALEKLRKEHAASHITQQPTVKTKHRARDDNGNKEEKWTLSTGSLTVNNVLMWPCIQGFLFNRHHDVVVLEQQDAKRANLCDENSPSIGDISVAAFSRPNDNAGDNGRWANFLGMSGMDGYNTFMETDAEIDRSGRLRLDATTAQRYFQSYLNRMHNLYPFLQHDELVVMVNGFIDDHCLRTPTVSSQPFSIPRDRGHGWPLGDFQANHMSADPNSALFPKYVEQNINNAVALLVFALGAIATHGPIHANSDRAQTTVAVPGLTLYKYATAILGLCLGGASIRHAQAALLAALYAGQIVRPLQAHGWMFQASRACKALLQPERYKALADDRARNLTTAAFWACLELENDFPELGFGACGVSNDELRVRAPGESFIVNFAGDEEGRRSHMTLFCFAIELNLIIKCANTAYMERDKHSKGAEGYFGIQGDLSDQLELWRSRLPDTSSWNDSDPPATNVEAARVRAMYYRARFLVHLPALFFALHCSQARISASGWIMSSSTGGPTGSDSACGFQHTSFSRNSGSSYTGGSCMANMHCNPHPEPRGTLSPSSNDRTLQALDLRQLPADIYRACKVCIQAAILYTGAFGSVENNPVVANTFGVAHA